MSEKNKTQTAWAVKLMTILVFMLVFWLPRGFDLDRFMATDEGAWLFRSADFYYALGQRDFDKTLISAHPGVVTTWVGTAALLIDFPEYRGLGQGYFGENRPFEDFIEANGYQPLDFLVTARVIMLLLLTSVAGISFAIAIELFGIVKASAAFLLIAFDPLYLGLTRMFHLDAPMGAFFLLSILLLLLSERGGKRWMLWLGMSGFMGGIAVLAKLPSALLAPGVVMFLLISVWQNPERRAAKKGAWVKDWILKSALWGGMALLAMLIFLPALWAAPWQSFQTLFSMAIGTSTGTMETADVFVQPTTFFFYNPLSHSYTNYLASFLWRTTPTVLAGLALALVGWRIRAGEWDIALFKRLVLGLLIFGAIYALAMSIGQKQSQKYFIPVHLVLDILAGFGWATLPALLIRVWKVRRAGAIAAGLGLLALGYQLALVLPTFPYYWTYYNPLLGGSENAGRTIFVGTGEGLDLVGEYLDQKPNPEEIRVVAWFGTGCISYFFEGTVIDINHDDVWGAREMKLLETADYLVTYSNQWFRNRPADLLFGLAGVEPEHRVWINGIEYARIYSISQLPAILYEN